MADSEKAAAFTEATGIKTYKWSVADYDACAAGIKQVEEELGPIAVLVNNAGITRDSMFHKMTPQQWKEVIDTNLTGTFLTIRDGAEAMVNGGWPGLLVAISSVNKVGQVGQLNYSSAKVADALLPKIVVGEFMLRGIRNVRCIAIAPGYTATPMLTGMNQDALQAILADVHLGRLVEPEEIARLIGHAVENEAINATTLEITGGLCYPGGIAK